jgi:glycosyltransferase involved in cell wall biosynthesis
MAKILILIGAHLCTAPRPQKEAEVLAGAGHEVIVRGFWFDPELVERDLQLMNRVCWRFEPILDFRPTHRRLNQWMRLQGRIARELYQRCKVFSPALLGYGAKAMLEAAQQMRADLTIVHSEAGLWVGNQLLNQGYRVGVDFEDWFSEDLLPKDQVNRPIKQLKAFEKRLLHECKYCLTTSHAMAEAMAKAHQGPTPTVVYNCFPWAERSQIDGQTRDRQDLSLPSLHWFSQTIGPGRGLEILFQALTYLKTPVEVHLRGNYSNRSCQWLESLVPTQWYDSKLWQQGSHRVIIHPTVPNAELLSRIAEHDVGLALESSEISSRNLTITNKLFQYLQAGLAIVATSTAGQKEIFSNYPNIGHLVSSNQPNTLAQALEDLLENSEKLNLSKSSSLRVAQNHLSWEKQMDTLLNSISTAVQF